MRAISIGFIVAGFGVASAAQAFAGSPVPDAVIPESLTGAPCFVYSGVPTKGTTYYVSPSGNDANNGLSLAKAFKTVGHAFNYGILKPGDVLLIGPGTYQESVEIRTAGAPGACVTVMGIPNMARPVITWSNNAYATINVWAPFIRISGLAVTHPEPNLNPKLRYNSGNSAIDTFSQVVKDGTGVLRPTVHHVQLDNNIAYGSGCGGISFESSDYVYVYGNTVYGNAYASGGHCSGISIYEPVNLDSASGYHQYVLDNFSYGNTNLYPVPGTTYTTDESGIVIDDTRQSQAKARSPSLPYVPYTGRTLVFGNILFANGGHAVEVYTSDYVDVFNNVAYENLADNELRNWPNCGGELYSGYSGHMRFENNIIVASLPTLRVMSQIGAAADQASNLWTHDIADVGQISLGAANAGNAAAAALYGVNPGFVSPSTNPAAATQSFRLQSNSRARGAGIATSLSLTDIAGETLPKGKNINIGAYLQ